MCIFSKRRALIIYLIAISYVLLPEIVKIQVIDSVINHSDHRPVSCRIKLHNPPAQPLAPIDKKSKQSIRIATQRDKANFDNFYNMSDARLQYTICDDCSTICQVGCNDVSHRIAIEIMYTNIVHALQQAEMLAVPHVPVNSLKPFWNAHLDSRKDSSIF
jgi:hypothetical protein